MQGEGNGLHTKLTEGNVRKIKIGVRRIEHFEKGINSIFGD